MTTLAEVKTASRDDTWQRRASPARHLLACWTRTQDVHAHFSTNLHVTDEVIMLL
jgi:hypothetical protein